MQHVGLVLSVTGGRRAGAQGIARSTSGLLFRDDFDRADGAVGSNWTVDVAGGGTWSISNGKLRADTVAAQSQVLKLVPVADRLDWHVQWYVAKSVPQNYLTAQLRRYLPNGPGNFATSRWHQFDNSSFTDGTDPNKARLYRIRDGAITRIAAGATNVNTQDQVYRCVASRVGTEAKMWVDGTLEINQVDANNVEAGGFAWNANGQGGAAVILVEQFIACAARNVQVSGLQLGQKAKIGTSTSAGADGTGIVQVDIGGQLLPCPQLQILSPVDAVLATMTDSIYGGDAYVVNL